MERHGYPIYGETEIETFCVSNGMKRHKNWEQIKIGHNSE